MFDRSIEVQNGSEWHKIVVKIGLPYCDDRDIWVCETECEELDMIRIASAGGDALAALLNGIARVDSVIRFHVAQGRCITWCKTNDGGGFRVPD